MEKLLVPPKVHFLLFFVPDAEFKVFHKTPDVILSEAKDLILRFFALRAQNDVN